MIDLTLQELSDIVEKLQNEIFETNDGEPYYIAINTNGCETYIEFLDMPIWNDEDDEREFIKETDKYEPMEQFLRNSINNIIKNLSKIKL